MNIAAIVSEIDAEIEKLRRIRGIVQGLSAPVQRPRSKRKQSATQAIQVAPPKPQAEILPQVVVLPPKKKRDYQPRTRPAPVMPKALARAPSTLPVFVPRIAVANAKPVISTAKPSEDALEAAIRQNLMGRVASRQLATDPL